MEIYKRNAESLFAKSYFDFVSKIKVKYNLTDIEAKEVICIVCDWLHDNTSLSDED